MLIIAQIIKSVMSSAAEAELGALYINAREAIPLRHLLEELGHTQPPTKIQIDNSTALQGHGHEITLVTMQDQPKNSSTRIGVQDQ